MQREMFAHENGEFKMSMRVPPDLALLKAACVMTNLPIDEHRLEQLLPAVTNFFQLLDALHVKDLGETPPSATFQASWTQKT